ncbi:MAG: response regulator [Lysobacteraceae bacterium]
MIKVFLLDDHARVRTGYRLILERETDMQVVGEAEDGESALPLIRQLKPDVVLCDLHLPGVSGLEVTERLAKAESPSRVVICSVQQDGPMPKRLLAAGAHGYVGKACDAQELLRAIREAARGRRYLAAEVAQHLALAGTESASPFETLSPREMEVAKLLCQGLKLEEIGRRLHLSGKTVATHKYRLLEKLSIKDTMSLARLATQYGVHDAHLSPH